MIRTPFARRAAGALALGGAVALTTTACGGGGPAESGAYETAPSDLSATITYGLWDQNQVPALEESIAAFNEQYPDITVNLSVTPFSEYWTKLQTQASSDTLPDVFWMNGPNIQLYALGGKIEPITGAVDAGDIDPAKYPESLVDLYTVDDVSYGVPKDFDTIGVWINTELFDRAGVEVPSADWTWEDFQDAAAEISEALADEGSYGAAGGMDGQTTYYDTVFQAGGAIVEDGASGYTEPATQAGLQFWADLIASGGSPSMSQLTDTSADQWFTSGKLAMYWGGSWFRPALVDVPFADSVDVLPLPRGEEQATVIHGVANVVASSSENKQAAQALQAYLAGEEAQLRLGEAGSIIPAYEGTQEAFTASMPDVDLQVFLDAVDYSVPLPVSANTSAWNALESELLPQAFSGERTVEDVTAELAEKMDEALAKETP
ncbi:ABC transporter substrate-binding protein [Microbacterium marinilacus]|uniref:Sugar ABC transporter substrate-binding protein n=1 Tax=Microbacterium marinilacus TaxID=415209 RepID=A0ABP7BNV4_9MICO|nr:sugar ABC transporter substrate-binding protein [Microbacterium marinilacus]MBY0690287.1 sugar ABC transporter substrate-binding protein [Microbacterium marinilacus]